MVSLLAGRPRQPATAETARPALGDGSLQLEGCWPWRGRVLAADRGMMAPQTNPAGKAESMIRAVMLAYVLDRTPGAPKPGAEFRPDQSQAEPASLTQGPAKPEQKEETEEEAALTRSVRYRRINWTTVLAREPECLVAAGALMGMEGRAYRQSEMALVRSMYRENMLYGFGRDIAGAYSDTILKKEGMVIR